MILVKLLSSILLQHLFNPNQRLRLLLPVQTLSKQPRLLASLAERQSRQTRSLYSTLPPNLLTEQLKLLSRGKSPRDSTSFHPKMGAKLRSPKILLVPLAPENPQQPLFLPPSWALSRVKPAIVLGHPHLLRLSIRKPRLANRRPHSLLRRAQNNQRRSRKNYQLQVKQLSPRNRKVSSIYQQPRQLPMPSRSKLLRCSDQPTETPSPTILSQTRCKV